LRRIQRQGFAEQQQIAAHGLTRLDRRHDHIDPARCQARRPPRKRTNAARALSRDAVHATLPQPLKMLSSHIMEHNAHHAMPTLLHYHLAVVQRELSLRFPSIARLTIRSRQMLAVIKARKVYDTDRHC
jgi:hypothetical protein